MSSMSSWAPLGVLSLLVFVSFGLLGEIFTGELSTTELISPSCFMLSFKRLLLAAERYELCITLAPHTALQGPFDTLLCSVRCTLCPGHRCVMDDDNEVRDRATFYLNVLEQKQKALNAGYILNGKSSCLPRTQSPLGAFGPSCA